MNSSTINWNHDNDLYTCNEKVRPEIEYIDVTYGTLKFISNNTVNTSIRCTNTIQARLLTIITSVYCLIYEYTVHGYRTNSYTAVVVEVPLIDCWVAREANSSIILLTCLARELTVEADFKACSYCIDTISVLSKGFDDKWICYNIVVRIDQAYNVDWDNWWLIYLQGKTIRHVDLLCVSQSVAWECGVICAFKTYTSYIIISKIYLIR